MGPFAASSSSPAASTSTTPLFAAPSSSSHGEGRTSYNPNRSYYFGGTTSEGSSNHFKQRRRNLRGRSGLFRSASGSPLAVVPTLLRAVLLSPLLVLVLYLTFRTSSRGGGGQSHHSYQRNSPAMAKTYYDHGSYKSSSSSSSSQQQRSDCRTGTTYMDHGVLKRDLCAQQGQPQQMMTSTSSTSAGSESNSTTADEGEDAATGVLLLPPPPPLQMPEQGVPMTTSAAYQQSLLLDSTATNTATIVRPRPQPKRMVANYYNPMMESTLQAQQQAGDEAEAPLPIQQRVIVQPSHLKKLGNAQPMQIVTSTGNGGDSGSTSALVVVQKQQGEEPLPQQPLSSSYSSSQIELLLASAPARQRPPIPLPSTGSTAALLDADPPLLQDAQPALPLQVPVPAAQMSRRQQQQQQQQQDSNVAYYYYDPRHVRTDARTGQIVLPDVVYDASGTPHRLSHLRARQVWMEPATTATAPIQAQQPLASSSTASMSPPQQMASTTAAEVVTAHLMGGTGGTATAMMVGSGTSGTGLPQWGESTATDQSIIICTVGLMALLVGAVSARRFRKQSILSACIENEALDRDDNYASAYGGLHPNHYGTAGGSSSSYKTFEGWRGDLEKFDV